MRIPMIGILGFFVVTVSSCSDGGERAADDGNQAALATRSTTFEMKPGVERLRQHKGAFDSATSQRESLTLQNAYWLGRLSSIAYSTKADIQTELTKLGLASDDDHFRYFENTCTDTQAFYVSTSSLKAPPADLDNPFNKASNDVAVLVFRGTEQKWDDLATDLYAWNRPNTSPIGNVHAGFMGALTSIWNSPKDSKCGTFQGIKDFLAEHHQFDGRGTSPIRKGSELYITGHSLGAALATLALTRTATDQCESEGKWSDDTCARRYVPVSGLVTFGSPRVGDRSFADTLARWMQDRTPIFRFVHGQDLVTDVPAAFGWSHPGFDGDEKTFKVLISDAPSRMFVSADGDRGKGSRISDHFIDKYFTLIEQLWVSQSSQ